MRFLFVRPEVCPWVSLFPTSGFLQIPPRDGHPCLRLYPSRYRADSGLSPVRTCARRAHQRKQEIPCRLSGWNLLSFLLLFLSADLQRLWLLIRRPQHSDDPFTDRLLLDRDLEGGVDAVLGVGIYVACALGFGCYLAAAVYCGYLAVG